MEKLFSLLSIALVIASYPYIIYNYKTLPDQLPVHINLSGEIDKYMSKGIIFVFPILLTILFASFKIVPKFDKYESNYNKFLTEMRLFEFATLSFFSYVAYLLIELSRHTEFDLIMKLMPALGLLMIICGFVSDRSKMTQFFGCKCRYAYTSEENWETINKMGGAIMITSGVAMLIGFWINMKMMLFVSVGVLIAGVLAVMGYSEIKMRNENKVKAQ